MSPTIEGTTMPGIVANVLVIPMSVPANGGAMSIWFPKNPEYIPPTNIVPRVKNTTAKVVLHPTNVTAIRQTPGGTEAVEKLYV